MKLPPQEFPKLRLKTLIKFETPRANTASPFGDTFPDTTTTTFPTSASVFGTWTDAKES